MLDEFAPDGGGTCRVDGAEARNQVVLEGLDGPLRCIDSVVVGFHELDFYFIGFKVRLYLFACYVVNDVEARLESSFGEVFHI